MHSWPKGSVLGGGQGLLGRGQRPLLHVQVLPPGWRALTVLTLASVVSTKPRGVGHKPASQHLMLPLCRARLLHHFPRWLGSSAELGLEPRRQVRPQSLSTDHQGSRKGRENKTPSEDQGISGRSNQSDGPQAQFFSLTLFNLYISYWFEENSHFGNFQCLKMNKHYCACLLSSFSCVWLLWNPKDCSPPDSSVLGIFQARIVEWVAMPSSRGSSWISDWTRVSHIVGRFFTHWETWEAQALLCDAVNKIFILSEKLAIKTCTLYCKTEISIYLHKQRFWYIKLKYSCQAKASFQQYFTEHASIKNN